MTNLRHYMITTLGETTSNFGPYVAEILGSDLLIPIPVLVLSSPGARFRFKFWDCSETELDSESNSETDMSPEPGIHPIILILIPGHFFYKNSRNCERDMGLKFQFDPDSKTWNKF